jgi:hypothetical protein
VISSVIKVHYVNVLVHVLVCFGCTACA